MGDDAEGQGERRIGGEAGVPRDSGNGRCAGGGGGGGRACHRHVRLGNHKCNNQCGARGMRASSQLQASLRCCATSRHPPRPSTRPAAPSGRCSEPCSAQGWHGASAIQGWRWAQGGKRACERLAPHSHACSAPGSPRRQIVVAKGRKHARGTAHRGGALAWHTACPPLRRRPDAAPRTCRRAHGAVGL